MSKHFTPSEPFASDTRCLGSQDRFVFSLVKSSERVVLDVFVIEETGEVLASVSSGGDRFTPAKFLETSVLPVYARRDRKLRYVQTNLGQDYADSDYQKLLTQEGISQVYDRQIARSSCEDFARAFHAEFCEMGTINPFYRSAEDLKLDLIDWLNGFNRHL
ncbi:hypothetical protein [Ruegeria profundi]|uniref:Integrase catalytic domain-containing protein n=1 Tax=Ruegeria profundi TaxID=1685378 RepID=A0A0X3TRT8_9RHOB|nr:hypothetical protein [Ruegeria profundi]KUJ77751.1 hypothetical protein AVO44_15580 [Ruegeria profundi]